MFKILKKIVLIALMSLANSWVYSEGSEPVRAQWKPYQVVFKYAGEFSHYNCEAIESKLVRLLLLLGARYDTRVETECSGSDNLGRRGGGNFPGGRSFAAGQRFHLIRMAFALPVVADDEDFTRKVFLARWQNARISGNQSRYLNGGDCELVEQFNQQVLPLLEVKNLGTSADCLPIRRSVSKLRAKMYALLAVNEKDREVIRR